MNDTDTAGALGKWFALLNGLRPRHCVALNVLLVLMLTVEHAEEIVVAANGRRPALRKSDDYGAVVVADYGIIEITKDTDGDGVTARESGETVFMIDAKRGPVEGRWAASIVTLAAIARQLEERFGRPGRRYLRRMWGNRS
jgi:hypothetical protein